MKKINNLFVLILVFAGIVVLNSCEEDIATYKKEDNNREILFGENETSFKYFIDNREVEKSVFDIANSEEVFSVDIYNNDKLKSTSHNNVSEKRIFSTKNKYLAYGEVLGIDFEKQLLFMEIMSKYAEESGVIYESEKSGIIPGWYAEREKFVYDSLFIGCSNLKSIESLYITLYDNHYVPGNKPGKCIVMSNQLPFMYPGWNDRVSCIEFVGLGGGLHICGKSFYRQHITTIINWGFTRLNLGSGVDNKMRSGMGI